MYVSGHISDASGSIYHDGGHVYIHGYRYPTTLTRLTVGAAQTDGTTMLRKSPTATTAWLNALELRRFGSVISMESYLECEP